MIIAKKKKKKNRPDFTTVTFFNKVGLILSFSFVGKINLAKNTMKRIYILRTDISLVFLT